MDECNFTMAWVGKCDQPSVASGRCEKHLLLCSSCGELATHDCDETGQFVCGHPLCDNCEHTIFPDGTNGGIGFNAQSVPEGLKLHCKKTDQKYKAWYEK